MPIQECAARYTTYLDYHAIVSISKTLNAQFTKEQHNLVLAGK